MNGINRFDMAEEKISEFEGIVIDTIQTKMQKKKNTLKMNRVSVLG